MNLSAKHLVKILESHSYILSRTKGSHRIYFNSENGKLIVVPIHGNKDLPKGTFYAVLKQAGIDKSEI